MKVEFINVMAHNLSLLIIAVCICVALDKFYPQTNGFYGIWRKEIGESEIMQFQVYAHVE